MNPKAPCKNSRSWSPPDQPDLPALPVREVHGTCPGPHLLVTAGVHGDEYEGPAAIEAWYADLDPATLDGRVTLLPVLNVDAWQARQRRSPIDDADLNRAFPGDPAGGPTARLAHAVWTTYIAPADAVIDLHSGGLAFLHLPLAGVYANAGDPAKALVQAFDDRFHNWVIPDVPGVLSREAHYAGKAAVGVEWGGGGALDPAGVAALCNALNRTLQGLGITKGTLPPTPPDARPTVAGDYESAQASGIFHPLVQLGDSVEKGDEIGTLINPLTGSTNPVVASRSGQVAGLAHLAWVNAGDRIVYLG